MEMKDLKPTEVFSYFDEICQVPRPSKKEEKIIAYLREFGEKHGLETLVDEAGNVLIKKPATQGMEGHKTVVLQAHIDMVCEKNKDVEHNFDTDPIETYIDGEWLRARGTTLGADNGIAVAYAMALMADKTIPHPPLEVIVTVDEEIGMLGADVIDLSMLKGRKLINMDSEDEGIFTVSCAGGCRATITLNVDRRAVYGPCIRLAVEGLQGGHSGAEIHKNRANANKIMGEFMSRIQKLMPLCLTSLAGGSKDNVIPGSCQATLVAMGINLERINGIAEQLQAEIREQYDEPNATVQAFDVDALGGNSLSTQSTAKVIELLCAAPNGVQSWSKDIEGLVQTSLNMGVVKLGDRLNVTLSVRSSVNAEKLVLLSQLKKLAEMFEADYAEDGAYPAWEFRKESHLRDVMVSTYKELFGKDATVEAIHAGLECGLFAEKIPGLDCVSIGPQMYDIHTSRERLEIGSTRRTWEFLLAVLKNL